MCSVANARVARVGRLHRRPCSPARGRGPKKRLRDPALGRSRGGLTTKIHLACDDRGRPLGFVVTGACPRIEKFRTILGTPAGPNELLTAYKIPSLQPRSMRCAPSVRSTYRGPAPAQQVDREAGRTGER
ncbi:hypothetical protein GCM10027028_60010 [Streptomyces sundarbansensis]